MAETFRRLSKRVRRLHRRFSSVSNLELEVTPITTAEGRAYSVDQLDELFHGAMYNGRPRRFAWQETENPGERCNALTGQWMEEWQVPLFAHFGQLEFKDRVETVKSAFLTEMDEELARDMRNYNLAGRRGATCGEMLNSDVEKAACILGILGF